MTRVPARIGKYEIVELFGSQCMGPMYKALDTALGDSVVIKVMTLYRGTDNGTTQDRFYRQAAIEMGLQHPNILAVRDIGQHDGSPYTVVEYADGESLDRIIESGRPLPLSDRIGYIIEVCRALSYVHRKRIVHRNIKSSNVLILKDGGVKICDFSVAYLQGEHNQPPSPHDQIAGTLTHMSPEQIRGQVVDARSDIFSTGIVLYHSLTCSLPFQGKSVAAVLTSILKDPPPPLSTSLGGYASQLQEITFRALAKDRELRYLTAEDLAFDLGGVRTQIAG